jgi:paraquat-inducible protein B
VPPQRDDGTPQIPTIPSDAARLKDEILGLNLPDMGNRTRAALASLQRALDELTANIGPLSQDLRTTLGAARTTLQRYDQLAGTAQSQITTNGKALTALLDTTQKTMAQASAVVASLDEITAPRSPQRADLEAALRDLAASSSSLRELTHDLERHPAATVLR